MDTAEKLIESTRQLLWERGYVGTSPKAIQQRAGAGQGSMYHHFSGKADLALAAVRRSADELRAEVERHLSGAGTPLRRIEAYLTRERDVLRGCQIGGLTQDPDIVASPTLREPVDATIGWLQTRLAEVVAQAQDAGEINDNLDAYETASALVAMLQGGYVLARAAQAPDAFDRAISGALAMLRTR
ncbi:TetR/AcrR family transcriptional regulator [Fodinicola acaciae]|uniref:TetR/AcrR family transcriptional regulator n=1 Tax=Fodinicola acaciae TaxID=2681555 RepID=UPI0013CFC6E1|nr:TetR/AcrR family transcriptional regulator [Fodinicola acaciae]